MSTSRIAVVGSANVDLTTFNDRFPRAGETIFGESFDIGFGGKGANQAVAAARVRSIRVGKLVKQSLKARQTIRCAACFQGRWNVAKSYRPNAAFGLCGLAGVIDNKRINHWH